MLTHLTTIINMKTNQKHFFRWLIRKTFYPQALFINRLAAVMVLLTMTIATYADRMNDNSYFTMNKVNDHLHFSLQMADAYGNNTYCDWGGIIATCGSQEIEVMILFSGDDNDDGPKWAIHAKDRNGDKWGGISFITNTYPNGNRTQVAYQSGDYTPSIDIMKNNLYPKVEIDFYWPASMSGKNWSFVYAFNHVRNNGTDGGWKTMNLGSVYLGNSPVNFNYSTPNIKDYTYTRERMDKLKFTVPELPDDIPSYLSSNRWFESDYELTMTYTMPSHTTQVIKNEILHGEVGKKKTFEVDIPNSVQKFTKMDLRVKSTSRIKSIKGNYFWTSTYDRTYADALTSTPVPKNLVTEYRQYDNETVLAWEAFSIGDRYIEKSVPYVYRIETNASGTPLSGQSWLKRDVLKPIGSQQTQSYTDQNVSSGKYYRYMVLNVPQDWINKGISTSDLNSPNEQVLERLPYTQSAVISTAPSVTIFGLHQDTEVEDQVRLKWQYSRIPVNTQTVNFQVLRRTSADGEWTPYGTVTANSKPAAGAMVSFEDKNLPDNKTRYDYKIVLEMNNGAYRFESDPVTAGLLGGTMVKNLQATKGTHDAVVRVTWNAKQIGTANSTYVLSRRYAGSTGAFMQIYTAHGTAEQYVYEDNTVMPGYYYEYKVDVYGGDEGTLQNVLTDVGFCQARGVISGLVNFGTGVAVKNVRMNLTTSGDDEAIHGYSKRIEGASTGLTWDAGAEALNRLFGPEHDFTVQMFVRPDEGLTNGAVVAQIPGVGNMYIDGMSNGGYNLSVSTLKGDVKTDCTLPVNSFSLLTLSRCGDQLSVQVNQDETKTFATDKASATALFSIGGAEGITEEKAFRGYITEVRVFDHALSESERTSYFDRTLNGRENGLCLYWPMDEGLDRYVFDASYANDVPNSRHATLGTNISTSALLPTKNQLSRYGVTNDKGEYIIRGIPFSGSGTSYRVVPELGIHDFSPSSRSMFISPSSITANNVDFQDVSSFPMEGYIYYAGTNVPAKGIQLYIDNELVTANGEVKQTDDNGHYLISVPIGNHYVEARLDGHTLVDGGRFPTEGTFNFDRSVTYDFTDSTLVNFVGRVGGGERNDTLAVGFGASKNNIGMATVVLRLNNDSYSFNCASDHISAAATERSWESDTTAIQSKAWTGTGDNSRSINIRTDSLTGEFSALLPPLKYIVKSVSIDSNQDIEFSVGQEVDLSNARAQLADTITVESEGGITNKLGYNYNVKRVFTYFASPQLDLRQKDNPQGAFGQRSVKYTTDEEGTTVSVDNLYSVDEKGNVSYRFGYPIYEMGLSQHFMLHVFEEYINRDGAKPVSDIIPMNNMSLTISNEMSSEQSVVATVENPNTGYQPGDIYELKNNELTLDDDGRGELQWKVGLPNIVSPYTRNFSVTMERKGRTYILGNLDAIVLGNITTGNNFITKGPDQVQFVLRDPPGAKSNTTLKVGQITTKTHYDTYTSYGDHSLVTNNIFGSVITTGQGLGFIQLSSHKVKDQLDVGTEAHWQYNNVGDTAVVTTTITSVSTGTSNPYVGSNGDVFVGTSYNFLIGSCRRLYLKRDDHTGEYAITLEDALALGDSIATTFNYSAYELETVMIPKWKDQRARFITRVASQAEAEAYVNTGSKDLYLSWVGEDDPDFGVNTETKKTYRYLPSDNDTPRIDSVQWCNNQIDNWVSVLYDNEKEKVMAMRNQTATNFSIDGGSTRTFSERSEIVRWNEKKTTWRMGAVLGNQFGFHLKNIVSWGIITKVQSNEGNGNTSGDGTKTQDYTEWEYTFADGNRDTDISINQYNSDNKKNSKIFSVFGGQTYNPYEPQEFTKYYEPGTPLGNGTVQMEQPNLMIGIGNEPPAKSVTITDIPAGSEANLTIYCTNMSNTHQGTNFSYNLFITERTNDKGLEILMDGVPVNGRSVFLDQGETTTKVLTIRQTDQGILDYEGIQLRFCSQYQPAKIADVVTINAHFKPSSSPVNLVIQEPILNTVTKDAKLQMRLTGFNRQFKKLKNIGVQYRFAGNTEWIDLHTWVTDQVDSTSTSFSTLPSEGDLRWAEDMSSNLSYPEGNYEFRAFTTTPYDNEFIRVYSDIVTVTKDLTRPRNLYTPSPAHGILGYGDQLAIEFNEDIVPGYVGDKNVIVTAKLNSQQVNHEVALHLNPFGEQPRTQNPVFLKGDFSFDFWLNWHDAGTLMHLGANTSNFALNIREDGYVVAKIAGNEFVSSQPMPKDNWTFVALAYKASSMTFDMLALSEDKSINLFQNKPVAQRAVQAVGYTNDNYLYLGGLNADIHALSLYDIYRDVHDAGATKNQSKDNYVYGLANYWPMDEGHGRTAADSRRTHDFIVPQSWTLENVNYALRIDNTDGVAADISRINTRPGDSYAVELWFDCSIPTPDGQVIFETATPGAEQDLQKQSDKLRLRRDGQDNLILDYGTKSQVLVNLANAANNEVWNHLIFNVVRGQAASFYLNGQRTAVIAEADVPPLTGSRLLVGKGTHMQYVDELRIWHASLSEQRLLQNIYNTIDTSEVYSRGLVAYYPFEQTGIVNGVTTKVPTLKNMMGDDELQVAQYTVIQNAPPIKNAPEEVRLIASPVASERKVVVNLTGAGISPRDIEGTTLNVTVDQIRDLHGNTSLPIRWSAYVQQNTLMWSRDSVNIIKQYGKGYTFDVNIENWSGNTEYYTLYNMPEWLTLVDSNTQDELAPIKTKTLRFEVNPQVAVGNYDVTIGLQGNLEILEPLRIVMKVRGEKPLWTVDPTKYEHQMNYIGQVYINGILMENAESMVAAFIDGECRGVASPEQVRGAAYVTMNVYGNSDPQGTNDVGKPITFRIWNASAGIAYTDVNINAYDGSAAKTTFAVNDIVGSFDQPVIWAKGTDVEQVMKLNLNWNWVSLGVDPADKRPNAVFPELTKWNTIIKGKSIEPVYSNGTEWAPSGAQIQSGTAYKIRITPATEDQQLPEQLSISGAQLDLSKTPVTLTPGWNWIAYTPLSTMTIGQALAAAQPEVGDYVKSQHAIAFYSVNGWEGSLKALESGHAYMYNSTANTEKSFIYPTVSAMSRAVTMKRAPEEPHIFTPIGAGTYPDNMSMVIRLLGTDETVIDTCEVAAFIDGECRGTTRANNGLYYLIIAGEGSGQPLELHTCINGKTVTIDRKLTFTTDQNIGTPWSPYVIDLSEVLTGITEISSNEEDDDEDWWSVQGFKIGHKPIQPGVYIHHGKKVTIK